MMAVRMARVTSVAEPRSSVPGLKTNRNGMTKVLQPIVTERRLVAQPETRAMFAAA